jgi:hypothetical protein
MGYYLKMASQQHISALLDLGWSQRRVARDDDAGSVRAGPQWAGRMISTTPIALGPLGYGSVSSVEWSTRSPWRTPKSYIDWTEAGGRSGPIIYGPGIHPNGRRAH